MRFRKSTQEMRQSKGFDSTLALFPGGSTTTATGASTPATRSRSAPSPPRGSQTRTSRGAPSTTLWATSGGGCRASGLGTGPVRRSAGFLQKRIAFWGKCNFEKKICSLQAEGAPRLAAVLRSQICVKFKMLFKKKYKGIFTGVRYAQHNIPTTLILISGLKSNVQILLLHLLFPFPFPCH